MATQFNQAVADQKKSASPPAALDTIAFPPEPTKVWKKGKPLLDSMDLPMGDLVSLADEVLSADLFAKKLVVTEDALADEEKQDEVESLQSCLDLALPFIGITDQADWFGKGGSATAKKRRRCM
ncbi:hypothetical protein DUNSADRAFT_10097 [Dunaliella salina]|uniref:Encoded protein n=1 Tax=Dunaliella salina TaxID=3046 RepID=A0ABQ7FTF9_DUNSA|nr:hypothetical protein DUNSADRAFT_10097 [Dunaliella salina]|eukprot:KAF5825428.1 hypothetical protein DUNSADRAFT_10097 [Dunaliella salina]